MLSGMRCRDMVALNGSGRRAQADSDDAPVASDSLVNSIVYVAFGLPTLTAGACGASGNVSDLGRRKGPAQTYF
jgi:hypothetical protein